MKETEYFDAYSSVENIAGSGCSALFSADSSSVFKDDRNISPVNIEGKGKYVPWGADNQMPYDIIRLIDKDETLSTCQVFNAEVLYGGGVALDTAGEGVSEKSRREAEEFARHNDLCTFWLGSSIDFKYFAFAVSVVILSKTYDRIVRIVRKEACYCRFAKADADGRIKHVYFADWRDSGPNPADVEKIPLLDPRCPLDSLREQLAKKKAGKFAVVTRIPTVDSTYYPIPYYASLFKGKWYNIKQYIGIAKESKIKNTAPIKYHIQVNSKYWENICRAEGITNPARKRARIQEEKQKIIDFVSGAENSGKAWFSTYYVTPDGKEQSDVKIVRIDSDKEGGDWQTDIQEAVNMICFTMRVHSNLVGSVPGKAQTNNSGSDKRELYTIAQALQRPYRDLLFRVFRLVCDFNGWEGVKPVTEFMQLTTLDEHKDAKTVKTE